MATSAASCAPQALALCLAATPLPYGIYVLVGIAQPNGVEVESLLALVGGVLWFSLILCVPPFRRLASDLCALLLQRIPCLLWFVLLSMVLLLATQHEFSGTWSGAVVLVLPLTFLSARKSWRSSRVRFLAITGAFVGVLATLVVLDQTLGELALAKKSHNSIFLVHDEIFGWRLRPDFHVERTFSAYTAEERTNSHGFRTRELPYEKPSNTMRVVLLGDSHTEGYTVSDHETYAVILQQRLTALRGAPVEVISLGVGGFSTDQEFLSYVHEGRRYDPDAVVLQFCPNDPAFNLLDRYWRGLKPHFEIHGQNLLLLGVPVPDRRSSGLTNHFLLKQSNFAKIAEGFLARFALRSDVQKGRTEDAWRITDLLIRDLAEWVENDDASFAVFNSNPDDRAADAKLRALLKTRDLQFIDIGPAFGGEIEAYRVPEDHHWNPEGHRVVAERLATALYPRLN